MGVTKKTTPVQSTAFVALQKRPPERDRRRAIEHPVCSPKGWCPQTPDWGGAIGETVYGNMGGSHFSAYTTPNSTMAELHLRRLPEYAVARNTGRPVNPKNAGPQGRAVGRRRFLRGSQRYTPAG